MKAAETSLRAVVILVLVGAPMLVLMAVFWVISPQLVLWTAILCAILIAAGLLHAVRTRR